MNSVLLEKVIQMSFFADGKLSVGIKGNEIPVICTTQRLVRSHSCIKYKMFIKVKHSSKALFLKHVKYM